MIADGLYTPAAPLQLAAFEVCTALGLDATTTAAEVAAGSLAFAETDIDDGAGEPARAARVPLLPPSAARADRVEALAAAALRAHLTALGEAAVSALRSTPLPVLLAVPEQGPAIDTARLQRRLRQEASALAPALRLVLDDGSLIAGGRAGFLEVLATAIQRLRSGREPAGAILVGAVDSQCDGASLRALAEQRRLLGGANSDGLLPGEAAGFGLVTASGSGPRLDHVTLQLLAVSLSREPRASGHPEPSLAEGLSTAFRLLRTHPGTGGRRTNHVSSGQTAESRWAEEFSRAYLRNAALMPEPLVASLIAQGLGDLGTAAGAVQLALAFARARELAGSNALAAAPARLLIYACSDSGAVGACVVEAGRPAGAGDAEPRRWSATWRDADTDGADARRDPGADRQPAPRARQLALESVERHFTEIGFLLSQRPGYCDDPRVGWRRTTELERRIGCHLDALAAWGAPGLEEACDAALALALGEDALLGAVVALASSGGDPDPWPRLIAALRVAEPPAIALWVQGLSLAADDGIGERLAPLLSAERPDLRVAAATVMGYRREADPAATASLLQALEPGGAPAAVRDAAALALGKLGGRAAAPHIDRALRDGPISGPLIEAALCLGVPGALDIARWSIRDGVELDPAVYVALALGGAVADAGVLLHVSKQRADARMAVNTALGVLGVAATMPALIDRLADEDPGAARAAAEGLHRITGASPQEKKWVPDDPDDSRPAPVVGAAGDGTWVERLSTDAAVWTEHYRAHPLAGDPDQRYRRGRPFRLEGCVAEAEDGTTNSRVRDLAIRELRARLARPARLEPDDWVARQVAGLSLCRSLCAEGR